MAYKLSGTSYKYSKGEQKVFECLNGKETSTTEILNHFYRGTKRPINGRKIIISVLRSLQVKIDWNKEPFRLASSKRRGPHPISVWLEKR
jgi:hypothetical protein